MDSLKTTVTIIRITLELSVSVVEIRNTSRIQRVIR